MLRLGAIFIVICMVLIAASLGAVLYLLVGLSGTESTIVALAALTALAIYNAVTARLRDRSDLGAQIADLSRGTADLARQVAELGRRTAALEGQGDRIADERRRKGARCDRADRRRARRARHPGQAARRNRRPARAQARRRQGFRRRQRAQRRATRRRRRRGARRRRSRAQSAPAATAGAEPRPRRNDRDRPRRDRSQPRRSLSAADRHAAAAQGALLRGVHAAADRGRHRAAAGRIPRRGGSRRPDAADRQPAAVPQRAGGAPAPAQEPRHRPVLQYRRVDAERPASCSRRFCNSWTPTARWRRRWCWNSSRARCAPWGRSKPKAWRRCASSASASASTR